MAGKRKSGQRSRLLLKPIGELGHEGKQVLKSNSAGLRILERFVTLVDGKIDPKLTATKYRPRPFFEG